jgi:hypothetical protein
MNMNSITFSKMLCVRDVRSLNWTKRVLRSFSPASHASCDASADAHRAAYRFRTKAFFPTVQAGGGTQNGALAGRPPHNPRAIYSESSILLLGPFREAQGTHATRLSSFLQWYREHGAVTDPPEGTLGR